MTPLPCVKCGPARDRLAVWTFVEHGAGLPCRYQEWIGGHDPFWWDQQLPAALAWLLAPP
jgi:hypothetical protein